MLLFLYIYLSSIASVSFIHLEMKSYICAMYAQKKLKQNKALLMGYVYL